MRGEEAPSLLSDAKPEEGEDVYILEIRGVAFLWHMVRCIMAVLLLVGEGAEDPGIVSRQVIESNLCLLFELFSVGVYWVMSFLQLYCLYSMITNILAPV